MRNRKCSHAVLKKADHSYVENQTPPTCTEDGSFEKVCSSCEETISGMMPALGHSWKKDEAQSVAASCAAAGKTVYVCEHDNCDSSYTEETPQLDHDYGDEEEAEADCGSQGHKKRICKLCGYEYVTDKTAPTGHDYQEENVVWTWDADYTGATAMLVCSYNQNHTKELRAVVTSELVGQLCQGTGELVYTAKASFNKYTYTDTKTIAQEKVEHQPEDKWFSDASGHSRKCVNCGESIDAGNHVWGQQTVVTEATCADAGLARQTCTICRYSRDIVLEATGEHNYVNGTCVDCGFAENSCGHIRTHKTPLDLSAYDICDGTDIRWVSCDCGEVKYLFVQSRLCNVEHSSREETRPDGTTIHVSVSTCRDCGLVVESSWYPEVDKATCTTVDVEFTELLINGEQIASGRRVWTEGEGSGQHMATVPGETVDLSELGDLCGVILERRSCYCGERSRIEIKEETCRWRYDSEQSSSDLRIWKCSVCGAVRKETTGNRTEGENCTILYNYRWSYEIGGEEIYSYTNQEIWTEHDYETVEAQLDGDSCTDGVYLKQICRDCGKVREQYSEYHADTERVETKLNGFCSDQVVQTVCACGAYKSFYLTSSGDSYCSWHYTDDTTAVCEECGLTRIEKVTTGEKNEKCEVVETTSIVYKDAEGKTVASGERRETDTRHNQKTDFILLGNTCEDGVKVTRTCSDCGHVAQYTTDYHERAYTTYDLAEYGLCGGELQIYRCACGETAGYSRINEKCQWENISGKNKQAVYFCPVCEVTRTETKTDPVSVGTCRQKETRTITFTKEDEKLLEVSADRMSDNHRTVYSLTLLGDNCEDGYYVAQSCVRCGEATGPRHFATGHNTWQTEHYDLTDYGLCGGEIWRNSCACGELSSWYYNDACSWNDTGETDSVSGLNKIYCAQCRTYRVLDTVGSVRKDSCDWTGTFYAKLTRDGETLLNLQKPVSRKEHKYVLEDVELHDPDQGCEGGYRATLQCLHCDNQMQTSGSGHSYHEAEYLQLSDVYEGACGDVLFILNRCACGEFSNMNWFDKGRCDYIWSTEQREGADGFTHQIESRVCKDCGFAWTEDSYQEQTPGDCLGYRNTTITFSANGQVLKTWKTRERQDSHTCEQSYSLLPGSSSCEDGLRVTERCKLCDYENSWYHSAGEYNHDQYNLDVNGSVDPADYGSVCGGKLSHYTCACGKQQRYDFSPETLCDIDQVSIANWIPGSIDTWQYTSEGQVWTDSESYLLTCAVTDPDCDLKIRMSEYWLEKNCEAIEYQTWQLGYDDLTGTFRHEFTVETGDRHAYHPYKDSSSSSVLDDGTEMNSHIQSCPQCGSSYTVNKYVKNGSHLKTEERAINTLNNGENKSLTRVYEYGVEHAGYRYETLKRHDVTYADGTASWYQYAYTYDFTNGCFRTETYTNSDGAHNVWSGHAHIEYCSQNTLKNATCTQYGEYQNVWSCKVCGEVYLVNTYDLTPTAHNWFWNDQKQFYECGDCGLENINGASGEIVLEDMTDSHGAGSNYVVGYWNRGGVDALRYVSVVLKDAAADENDELVLTDIDFTYLTRKDDGITAVSFSQEAVRLSAQKAVADAGYTGEYAIRFIFVPKYSADTLDYAITFDELAA